MRIEHRTKYQCDGCRTEQENPAGWQTMVPLMAGSFTMVAGSSAAYGSDFCATCVKHMRAAVAMPRETVS